MGDASVRHGLPAAHLGRRSRRAVHRPLRSGRIDDQGLNTDGFPTRGFNRLRQEISLGKQHVDPTFGPTTNVGCSSVVDGHLCVVPPASVGTVPPVVQMVDRSFVQPSVLPADVHLDCRSVGAPSMVNRPRVVPLRAAGAFGRRTPLGHDRHQ
ncbi:hypothetical protein VPH35_069161 [Triticum aestivum]